MSCSVWGEGMKTDFIMQKLFTKYTFFFFLSANWHTFFCTRFGTWIIPGFPDLTFTWLSLLAFPPFSALPAFPHSDPFTTPFSYLLSSLHPSIHPPISAQGGLALFLSDVWKCQPCEGTGTRGEWGGASRQPVKLLSHSGPGDWLTGRHSERQKVFTGLSSNGSIHGPQQLHSLEFSLFSPSHFVCFFSLVSFRTSTRMGENRWSSVWGLLCWVSQCVQYVKTPYRHSFTPHSHAERGKNKWPSIFFFHLNINRNTFTHFTDFPFNQKQLLTSL